MARWREETGEGFGLHAMPTTMNRYVVFASLLALQGGSRVDAFLYHAA